MLDEMRDNGGSDSVLMLTCPVSWHGSRPAQGVVMISRPLTKACLLTIRCGCAVAHRGDSRLRGCLVVPSWFRLPGSAFRFRFPVRWNRCCFVHPARFFQ